MEWETLRNASVKDILDWAEPQSWCRAMAQCAQDLEWHAEGDVWTHTKMVCDELKRLDEWDELSSEDRTILIFAALFHDAAKPLTTQVDPVSGRIRTPKHAVKGEHLARQELREIGCDLESREQIARLVRFHGRPAFLHERLEPTHEVARLSWLCENRLLYLFAIADTRGRNTDSMTRPEENLHFWKFQAEELGCYDKPYPFVNDHARFTFFRQEKPNLHYVPHEDYSCHVTVMCGLPGAGKDTWLRQNRGETHIVSLDGIRREMKIAPTDNQGAVIQTARERCRELLRKKQSFAFNATNLLRQTRARWIDLFADYGARIKLVYLEPSMKTILRQNKNRSTAIPENVINRLAKKMEPPTCSEAHELLMVDKTS